jgi:DeoR/GlpR family transcriptional regulator of sugar metabolism
MTNRHTKILEALSKSKRVDVTTLAEMLDVSQVTVRKDQIGRASCRERVSS